MPVLVDLTAFERYGIAVDEPAVDGKIVALGPAGVTVKLNTVLNGFDTLTLEPARVAAA